MNGSAACLTSSATLLRTNFLETLLFHNRNTCSSTSSCWYRSWRMAESCLSSLGLTTPTRRSSEPNRKRCSLSPATISFNNGKRFFRMVAKDSGPAKRVCMVTHDGILVFHAVALDVVEDGIIGLVQVSP